MSTSTDQGKRSAVLRRLVKNRFENITSSDLKFMGVLWSSEFIRPWVQIWAQDSLRKILRLQDSNSSNVRIHYVVLFVLKLVVTIAVSIAVDMRNHKFLVYLVSLFVFAIGPIFGVLAAIVQTVVLHFLPLWLTASLFVTYPTKFCLIFNQRPNASATETREVVALFEMANSLSVLALFVFLFCNNSEFIQAVIIVIWIILIVLIAGLIMLTFLVRKYSTKEVIKEPNILAVLDGMRQDVVKNQGDSSETVKRKTACAQRFIVFVLLLLPLLVITSFDVVLTIIDSFTSINIKDDSPNKVYKFLVKLVAIPGIGLLFSGVKGIFGTLGDLLVIAAAHTFNTIVIFLIVLYFSTEDITIDTRQIVEMSRSEEVTVVYGHIPNSEQAVFRIYGGRSTGFIVTSTAYNSLKPYLSEEFVVDVKHGPMSFEMQIQNARGGKPLHVSMEVEPNKRYWFLLLGVRDEFTDIVRVFGVDESWTFENPKVLVFNGIVRGGNPADFHKLVAFDEDRNVRSSCSLTISNMSASMILKPGRYKFSYGAVEIGPIDMKPYAEYAAIISNFNGPELVVFKTLEIRPKKPTTSPPTQKSTTSPFTQKPTTPPFTQNPTTSPTTQKPTTSLTTQKPSIGDNKLLQASYGLSGLTQAAATVGYLHFFWMESPVRLRTTLLAFFFVINETVAELTVVLVDNFGKNEALVYLALSCCVGLFHICLALLYDLRFRHVLQQPVEETIPGESLAPDLSVSPPVASPAEEKTSVSLSVVPSTEGKTQPKTGKKKWWPLPW